MKIKILLQITLFAVIVANTQPVAAQNSLKQANKHFDKYEYALAVSAYKNVLESGQPSLPVVKRIADSYRLMNNNKEAEFWYAQVVSFPEAEPENMLYYADAAKYNGNFAKARELYQEYGKKTAGKGELVAKMVASIDSALAWQNTPRPFVVTKAEGINSGSSDFSPIKFKDGIIFASDRLEGNGQAAGKSGWTGNGYIQLYFAPATSDSTWGAPVALPAPVNTRFHNGPAAFLEDESLLFFTRVAEGKRKRRGNPDPTSWFGGPSSQATNRLEIYTAELKNGKWENVKPFKYNRSDAYSVGHPAVTPDGRYLYFVSDMPGGLGETDIYYSERQPNGSWGKPEHAGNSINTQGRESFPTIGADGNLYFSSDGHIGMGGLDLFRAVGSHGRWEGAENLQFPINSSTDDFGIQIDSVGKSGWLASDRLQANATDNIFTFNFLSIPCSVMGVVVETVRNGNGTQSGVQVPIENALVQLLNEETGTLEQVATDAQGRFFFNVMGGVQYTIRGSKGGYLTHAITRMMECVSRTDTLQLEVDFTRDTPEQPIILNNIYYDLDKAEIRPDAARELDKLVRTLQENPSIRIELSSHTDSRQTHEYNQRLSEARAQAAVDYIVSRGIPKNRITAKGYGETRILNRCVDDVPCSEEEHQLNRRTEFKILAPSLKF